MIRVEVSTCITFRIMRNSWHAVSMFQWTTTVYFEQKWTWNSGVSDMRKTSSGLLASGVARRLTLLGVVLGMWVWGFCPSLQLCWGFWKLGDNPVTTTRLACRLQQRSQWAAASVVSGECKPAFHINRLCVWCSGRNRKLLCSCHLLCYRSYFA